MKTMWKSCNAKRSMTAMPASIASACATGCMRAAGARVSFLVRRRFPAIDRPLHDFVGRLGFALLPVPPAYYEDDLCSLQDHSFVDGDCFRRSYERAVKASKGVDHCIRWRVHILLWVVGQAAKLRGEAKATDEVREKAVSTRRAPVGAQFLEQCGRT